MSFQDLCNCFPLGKCDHGEGQMVVIILALLVGEPLVTCYYVAGLVMYKVQLAVMVQRYNTFLWLIQTTFHIFLYGMQLCE